jgi:hypothetical protein
MILLNPSSVATPGGWNLLRRAARIASIAVLHRQVRIKLPSRCNRATELPNRLLVNEHYVRPEERNALIPRASHLFLRKNAMPLD